MARDPEDIELSHFVQSKIARATDLFDRLDGRGGGPRPSLRPRRRSGKSLAKRAIAIALASGALLLGAIVIGFVINGIGQSGVFIVAILLLAIIVLASAWPEKRVRRVPFTEQMPTPAVVAQLGAILERGSPALPPPAAREAAAIRGQLPRLESRLATLDPLDPLHQDARRLMGVHLPELIDRYERVAGNRTDRDNEGLTVDQRLEAGLQAANEALSAIGSRLERQDRDALEVQGRFIESRYRDPTGIEGS